MSPKFSVKALAFLLAACLCANRALCGVDEGAPGFTYEKLGNDWGGLCDDGREQSPILVVEDDLIPIEDPESMVKVEALGTVTGGKMFLTESLSHVEIVWEGFSSPTKVTVPADQDGNVFAPITGTVDPSNIKRLAIEPIQFHFHTPSENALNGKLFAGVIHIVNLVKDGESKYCDDIKAAGGLGCPVVLSIFIEEGGLSTPLDMFLSRRAKSTDTSGNHVLQALGKKNALLADGDFDITELLPTSGEYATWPGSLTTAPCTEGVLWVQFLRAHRVGPDQIKHLQEMVAYAAGEDCDDIVDGLCTPPRVDHNNRLLQPLHGRQPRKGSAF